MQPQVSMIGVSFNCGTKLNLSYIYSLNKKWTPLRYDRSKFPGLRARLLKSKTTALIFPSGYVSIIGARSEDNAQKSAKEVVVILHSNGHKTARIKNFKIESYCGFITTSNINLVELRNAYPLRASYETELFPALHLNLHGKIFTIHHTGKIFSTGYKTLYQMNCYFREMLTIVNKFFK